MVDEAASPLILDVFIDLLNVGGEKWGHRWLLHFWSEQFDGLELLFKGNQEFSFKHAKFEMPTGYLMITWVCISEGSFALENIVVGWYLSLDIDELA